MTPPTEPPRAPEQWTKEENDRLKDVWDQCACVGRWDNYEPPPEATRELHELQERKRRLTGSIYPSDFHGA